MKRILALPLLAAPFAFLVVLLHIDSHPATIGVALGVTGLFALGLRIWERNP